MTTLCLPQEKLQRYCLQIMLHTIQDGFTSNFHWSTWLLPCFWLEWGCGFFGFNSIFDKGFSLYHSVLDKVTNIMVDTIDDKVWPRLWLYGFTIPPSKLPCQSKQWASQCLRNKKYYKNWIVHWNGTVNFIDHQNGTFIQKGVTLSWKTIQKLNDHVRQKEPNQPKLIWRVGHGSATN